MIASVKRYLRKSECKNESESYYCNRKVEGECKRCLRERVNELMNEREKYITCKYTPEGLKSRHI